MKKRRVVAGKEVTLFVETSDGFKPVGGQEFTEVDKQVELLNITTKASNGKTQHLAGHESYSITTTGFYVVNDAGFEALEVACDYLQEIAVKVKVGDLYEYVADVIVESLPIEFGEDEAKYQIKLACYSDLLKNIL